MSVKIIIMHLERKTIGDIYVILNLTLLFFFNP